MLMRFLVLYLICATLAPLLSAADELESRFKRSVQPFLSKYCVSCHNSQSAEGDLDLESDRDLAAVVENFRHWMVVMDRLQAGDMPPEDAEAIPDVDLRKQVLDWISDVRRVEAERRAGDPGIVLARRLSNAEYNYTIRDLTGQDIRPAQSFPIDPANQEGFDNSGESLTMSPSLLNKYLEASRFVADHAVLTPTGIDFAPHPTLTDTDRDKYCVNRIIDFYERQRLDYADFLFALWQYGLQVAAADGPAVTLEQFAAQQALSPRYMRSLWTLLTDAPRQDQTAGLGPIAALRTMWAGLPKSSGEDERVQARDRCEQMQNFIVSLRRRLVPEVENLTTPEVHNGSQALVLWKNRQFVANRRRYAGGALELGNLDLQAGSPESNAMIVPESKDAKAEYEATFAEFCSVFPDAFVVSQRARVYLNPEEEKERTGRYLSAGFHSQMGYFRDDQPLYDLILSDQQREELDRLWLELDFITAAPMRQYAGFIWFDRTDSRFMRDAEFDRFRAEDKDCTSEDKVRALAETYIAKAIRVGGNPEAIEAIRFYFDDMSRTFRKLEKLHLDSQPVQVDALVAFAEQAYRQPLTEQQQSSIRDFYLQLRQRDGLTHEDAIRDSVVAILMSPNFCYRLDLPQQRVEDADVQDVEPLDDVALANRLSYFLWSSLPDDELMNLASQGKLHAREELRRQVRRMLNDPKAKRFATEFAGNWLGFRRFEQHNGVDRNRFPTFTDQLRQSMYEEPLRLFSEIVSHDKPVLDLINADYTFVDDVLAEHYSIPKDRIERRQDGWGIVRRAGEFGRGGILPMAVFLTKNSPGLRTSPVQRGNWLVKQVLGEHIPAPPAAVPELPSDEAELGQLTLREALERHRADPNCAACHDRIDSFGLVFEQYGPVGERRELDFGGRKVDSRAVFPDNSSGVGFEGLRDYIRRQRQTDFVDHFCRKLYAYALGRSLQLSDEIAIEEMKSQLESVDYRIQSVFESIVTSSAFLNRRR